ncbi:FRG domain-containing protein [Verminephrobacter aporrectodeae]|uniref:FRG domain-containing protein n=1 Tax=Verminephrobacter aporrectodeae TaxID=1110389 RepID=UPI002243414D|nr:FRG domain-containing protein [Verminephrobacter aporrectodeae]MCW8174962.1 FRG domain-containing protein [Verminephrobacter aporrectodeae subsp. tuberculatae]MCW8196992.1 FRG domain-containing protein [Verminephrobacter aporrectodeae subsp. tuberculatae]MCW8201559.1 FRG domain-containing protein [Verminephrobacter aporrectodeae subsp. tuberculatae]
MSETTPSIFEQIARINNIPPWKSTNTECFKIVDGIHGGHIPVARLESWQDFAIFLRRDFFSRPGVELIFRGHRRFDWDLTSTLGRICTKGIVSERLALAQLKRFRLAVRGRLENPLMVTSEEKNELWAIGQHFGLMTPLLDWTYSPYVALFFAFHEEDSQGEENNPYRAVYVLNKSFLDENQAGQDGNGKDTGILLVDPYTDYNGRLVNQAGLFTIAPFESTLEIELENAFANKKGSDAKDSRNASGEEQSAILARHIYKIYIPNKESERDICLRHLRHMNVHYASLFPDLLGASKYCNIITAEAERQAAETTPDPVADRSTEPIERTVEKVAKILRSQTNTNVTEPSRIDLMAQELAQFLELEKNKVVVVDFNIPQDVFVYLRNKIYAVLRKYGYPNLNTPNTSRYRAAMELIDLIKEPSA